MPPHGRETTKPVGEEDVNRLPMLPAAGTNTRGSFAPLGEIEATMAALVSKDSLCPAGVRQAAWRCSSSACPKRTLRSSHSQMSVASAAARRTASGSLRSARIHDLT